MKTNGYTLIEIVIVIAIIALMALVAVPAFNRYNLNNNFESKAEEISVLFNKAYASSQSPIRSIDSAENEYNCDIVSVTLLEKNNFNLILRRTQPDNTLINCNGGTGSSNTVSKVTINDNPALDTLSLEGIASTVGWRFENDSMVLGDTDFMLKSSQLGRTITFKLRDNNGFYIEHD